MNETKAHDPKAIAESQAFRAINMLIDRKVDELKWKAGQLNALMASLSSPALSLANPHTVPTRVSYEEGGRREVEIPLDIPRLKNLRSAIDDAERIELEIAGLQGFKLRLLGDPDFARGDLSEQFALFGNP